MTLCEDRFGIEKQTQGRMPCEDRGRVWSDGATTYRMPRSGRSQWKLGEKYGTDSHPKEELILLGP